MSFSNSTCYRIYCPYRVRTLENGIESTLKGWRALLSQQSMSTLNNHIWCKPHFMIIFKIIERLHLSVKEEQTAHTKDSNVMPN